MSLATIGYSSELRIGDGATPTEGFTAVAELLDSGGPSEKTDVIDATHMASPGATREKIAGMLDSGQVTANMHFIGDDASQAALRSARAARQPVNFQLAFGDTGVRAAFAAIVSELNVTTPLDQKITMALTLDITGVVVFEADA